MRATDTPDGQEQQGARKSAPHTEQMNSPKNNDKYKNDTKSEKTHSKKAQTYVWHKRKRLKVFTHKRKTMYIRNAYLYVVHSVRKATTALQIH